MMQKNLKKVYNMKNNNLTLTLPINQLYYNGIHSITVMTLYVIT